MDLIIAPIDKQQFDVERDIEYQIGVQPMCFSKMNKTTSGTCRFFQSRTCKLGDLCPLRHESFKGKAPVCKHWLRGLCKLSDLCTFSHQYDLVNMPTCYFNSKSNTCSNKECMFLHVNKENEVKDCPWYNRGFCSRGPDCKLKHQRRILCPNYKAGFCPNGANCERGNHGKYRVSMTEFKKLLKAASSL